MSVTVPRDAGFNNMTVDDILVARKKIVTDTAVLRNINTADLVAVKVVATELIIEDTDLVAESIVVDAPLSGDGSVANPIQMEFQLIEPLGQAGSPGLAPRPKLDIDGLYWDWNITPAAFGITTVRFVCQNDLSALVMRIMKANTPTVVTGTNPGTITFSVFESDGTTPIFSTTGGSSTGVSATANSSFGNCVYSFVSPVSAGTPFTIRFNLTNGTEIDVMWRMVLNGIVET